MMTTRELLKLLTAHCEENPEVLDSPVALEGCDCANEPSGEFSTFASMNDGALGITLLIEISLD